MTTFKVVPDRVLVVDDDPKAADGLATLIRFWGYEVREAYNGLSAIETAHSFCPCSIIMDLDMPAMNGMHAAKALRSKSERSSTHMTLIALTGSAHIDKQHVMDVGFDIYLPKPLQAKDLFSILDQVHLSRWAPTIRRQ